MNKLTACALFGLLSLQSAFAAINERAAGKVESEKSGALPQMQMDLIIKSLHSLENRKLRSRPTSESGSAPHSKSEENV